MSEIRVDDLLLKFFHKLLDNEIEREILSMLFKEYSNDKIVEKLIEYISAETKNA